MVVTMPGYTFITIASLSMQLSSVMGALSYAAVGGLAQRWMSQVSGSVALGNNSRLLGCDL
jgi:hypothetical protein